MLQLHRKANRKEVVVGWYASTATDSTLVADTSSLIHDFYATETDYDADPVHVVVDTRLLTDSLQVKAYTSVPVTIQNEPIANLFHEISVTLESTEAERICLTEMQKSTDTLTIADTTPTTPTTPTTAAAATTTADDGGETKKDTTAPNTDENPTALLQVSMKSLMQLLETTSAYVDDVVAGKITGDAKVGRQIADTLAEVPRIRPAVFDRVFHEQLQDLLLVTYLSKITRTQLDITEKLHASLGI
jgi:translation initiation factor 3 subunit F